MIETINKVLRTSRYLVQQLGREPTPDEIAKQMEMPADKIRKVLKIVKEPVSLETPIGDDEESSLGDFVEDRQSLSPADAAMYLNLEEQTRKVLATLTPREEQILRMFDLHASGSLAMMQQTVTEVNRICRNEQLRRPKILAVTVLTSLTRDDLRRLGVQAGVESQVVRLAKLAREASMDGVVASPLEIARIRKDCGRGFLIVTPGVRSAKTTWDDQKRVLTPEQAIAAGADYIVVGKPIRDAKDPSAAAREIVMSCNERRSASACSA